MAKDNFYNLKLQLTQQGLCCGHYCHLDNRVLYKLTAQVLLSMVSADAATSIAVNTVNLKRMQIIIASFLQSLMIYNYGYWCICKAILN